MFPELTKSLFAVLGRLGRLAILLVPDPTLYGVGFVLQDRLAVRRDLDCDRVDLTEPRRPVHRGAERGEGADDQHCDSDPELGAFGEVGDLDYLKKRYGLTAHNIVDQTKKLLKRKR